MDTRERLLKHEMITGIIFQFIIVMSAVIGGFLGWYLFPSIVDMPIVSTGGGRLHSDGYYYQETSGGAPLRVGPNDDTVFHRLMFCVAGTALGFGAGFIVVKTTCVVLRVKLDEFIT